MNLLRQLSHVLRNVSVSLAAMLLSRRLCVASPIALLCMVATPTLAAVTPMAAAGWDHTVALKSDGTLVAVGNDSSGQLGLGRLAQSSSPLRVFGTGQVRSLAAGISHVITLKQDGTVWTWGKNYSGQLGDGTHTDSSTPVQAKGLTEVSAIAAGYFHSIALRNDGTVWEWGGQFWAEPSITPTLVPDIAGVSAIGGGFAHTVALKQDGTVWAWGSNSSGQLGDGTNIDRSVPVQAIGLTGVARIAVNKDFTLALKQDGTVWAWGNNEAGELGDGTNTNRNVPTKVLDITGVTAIFATARTSFAVKQDGTVWAWGNNSHWNYGFSSNDRNSPVQVNELNQIISIAGGWNYSVGLKQDGTVLAWGGNEAGQLGNGANDFTFLPTQVAGLTGVTMIAARNASTFALTQDGSVWAWGLNDFGQLGDLGSISRSVYAQVPGLTEVISVAAGYKRTHALKQDGTVWAWGENLYNDLGDGTNINRSTPVQVSGLTGITAIAEGAALKQDGTVFAWDGIFSTHPTPTLLSGLANVTAVTEGLALKQDGTVWTWDSSTDTSTQVLGLGGVTAIAARRYGQYALAHYVAVKQDGTVWAWGNNSAGQLGDGTRTTRSAPVQVTGLTDVIAIATGLGSTRALKRDGTVWAWGTGPVCDGTNNSYLTPTQVMGLTGVSSIAAGGPFVDTVAVKADGSTWVCGSNDQGQLGDGTYATRLSPVLAVNEAANGFLKLNPGIDFEVPPGVGVPFFVVASGGIADTSASVSTTTRFNSADVGKSGAVFVTATVPPGSLVRAQSAMSAIGASGSNAIAGALSAANPFVLIQLTSSGWQPVVNNQLLPYASGVLGDQLSAQTILNGTDTSNLKGAEFCLGYGTSAEQMIAAGAMRAVASIPDPNATSVSTVSCIVEASVTNTTTTTTTTLASTTTSTSMMTTTTTGTTTTTVSGTTTTTQTGLNATLNFAQGWNLAGNGADAPIDVASTFSDTNSFTTVWKWIAAQGAWAFHAPSLAALGGTALADYVASKGYQPLTTIAGGEGFWVNAKKAGSVNLPSGNPISVAALGPTVIKGWNLVSVGGTATPKQFCDAQSGGVTTLWAWDATGSAWYFYAPSLDASNELANYITSKDYLDFTANIKTLGPGVGFWVNRP